MELEVDLAQFIPVLWSPCWLSYRMLSFVHHRLHSNCITMLMLYCRGSWFSHSRCWYVIRNYGSDEHSKKKSAGRSISITRRRSASQNLFQYLFSLVCLYKRC